MPIDTQFGELAFHPGVARHLHHARQSSSAAQASSSSAAAQWLDKMMREIIAESVEDPEAAQLSCSAVQPTDCRSAGTWKNYQQQLTGAISEYNHMEENQSLQMLLVASSRGTKELKKSDLGQSG